MNLPLEKARIERICGNGKSIRCWLDFWIGDLSLANSYLALYSVAINKNCNVLSQYKLVQGQKVWRIRFNFDFNESMRPDLNNLIEMLNVYNWNNEDGYIWKWTNSGSSGSFSVNS